MNEVPVHLDDIVLELTEADGNWLAANAIARQATLIQARKVTDAADHGAGGRS